MNKKTLLHTAVALTLALPAMLFAADKPATGKPSGPNKQTYTCPMKEHADVKLDKPGKCPKCGMKLEVQKDAPKPPKS